MKFSSENPETGVLDDMLEYLEQKMLERDQFSVLCAKCGAFVGRLPGLCEELAEGRLLDEIRQHHLNCPKIEKPTMKKYVVLEHLRAPDRGFRFWSLNSPEPEKLADGSVAYKKVLETDDPAEALKAACHTNFSSIFSLL